MSRAAPSWRCATLANRNRESGGQRPCRSTRRRIQPSRKLVYLRLNDTIVAIATPHGRGGIGVVRLSGANARAVAAQILHFPAGARWKSWTARLANLLDDDGHTIDNVVVTFFEAPRSYTAEDVVEISCHGSPVVLAHCLRRAAAHGARFADPGEFTLRAYLNGRIDLPQAEAVRDLIEATTLYQARIAARQSGGSVSRRIAPLKEQLLELISLLEAGIDFAEDDVSVAPPEEILNRIAPIDGGVTDLIRSFAFGKLVHQGVTLAIVGRPNVGKSSLFNRLVEADRAIVTDIPGTTRDTVSESAAIDGIPVRFVDTAGIRAGSDSVESLGIERSFQAMADADLTLVVLDASLEATEADGELVERAREQGKFLLVGNKSDLTIRHQLAEQGVLVSAKTGGGVAELRRRILQAVNPDSGFSPEDGFITSLRHERLLKETQEALAQAAAAVRNAIPHEMLLLDLYSALRPIDAITGATTADDILNRIFATFCIGK